MDTRENGSRNEESEGVLLYYKYTQIPDVTSLVSFYESNCKSLCLLGRVRVAPHGVNVTVGGKLSSLEKHMEAMRSDALFEGTDFKLAICGSPSDERIARECGFTDFSVRVVKELVTFRCDPLLKSPEISYAGRHLSATEFHSVLHDTGKASESQATMQQRQFLLLDARNLYETRIGKFLNPNVETLDPEIRQYSDLPAWIDEHAEQLHGKNVLMYCTGGIRCEMASAYIRSKGAGFENVFQLFGGIQRYLEQFPGGGFFKGKNFVFDHRVSVGSQSTDIIGSCLICDTSFDDYSSRCRCSYCRMLVLVCYSCQGNGNAVYVCELCKNHGKGGSVTPSIKDDKLHSHSLHSLDPEEMEPSSLSGHITSFPDLSGRHGKVTNSLHRKLKILCLHGFRQNASSFRGRTSSLAKKLKNIAELVFVDAPHELPFIYQATDSTAPHEKCKKRFAWLVAFGKSYSDDEAGWIAADKPFDPLQYQQQTNGFEESYSSLKKSISQLGPFDGILGFSQGSAMAALFLEQQQATSEMKDFRFAILCSGFSVITEKLGREMIRCPTLHVFGDGRGKDRQIECEASRKLADQFDEGCSVLIEHDMGHIIPTCSPYIDRIKEFLQGFL